MTDERCHGTRSRSVPLPTEVLDTAPWLAYQVDLGGDLGWWNERFSKVTGYSEEELATMTLPDLLTPESSSELEELMAAVEPDGCWEAELDVVTRDGRQLPFEHGGSVVLDDSGSVVGLTALARAVPNDQDEEEAAVKEAAADGESDSDAAGSELWTCRQVLGTLGAVVGPLVGAESHAAIERVVCETLAASELYNVVWIGHAGRDGRVTPVTGAGVATEAIDSMTDEWAAVEQDRPAERTLETGETNVVRDIASSEISASVREFAADNEIRSGASVAITDGEAIHGVIVAYSTRVDGFGDVEVDALERIADVTGLALNAAQRERLVLSEPSIELELRLTGPELPLVRLAEERGISGRMEWMTQDENGEVIQFFTLRGCTPETVVETFERAPNVVSCRPVGDGDSDVFEVRLTDSAAGALIDAGAETKAVEVDDRGVTLVATAPKDTDVRTVVERVESVYSEVQLIAKRTLDDPSDRDRTPAWSGDVSLTDRQFDALATAFDAGYFEWPRDATAEEVAEEVGVSAATLHYHLRRAERALAESFLRRKREKTTDSR